MLNLRLIFRTARKVRRDGFTLVELLVVIGIIAILAGVALGPITNGIKKAKQSSALQSAHAIGLALYSCANDNSQVYPDKSGGNASDIAKSLLAGGYVSDPTIFFISGGKATKYSGTVASAVSTIAQTNMSWDFGGNNGTGLSSTSYQYLPIAWTTVSGGTEPTLTASQSTAITAAPLSTNPFGTAGAAVFYINNSSAFCTASITGTATTPTVTMVSGNNNSGEASSTAAAPLLGGG